MRDHRSDAQCEPRNRRQLQYRCFDRLQHSSMMKGGSSSRQEELLGARCHDVSHRGTLPVSGASGRMRRCPSCRRPSRPRWSASSGPEGDGVDRVLDRIRKLRALAGSDNQHEAEAAMRRAHELMLRHNIEHVPTGYEVRHLGDPRRRTNRVESDVMGLLSECFFVKVIRVPVYLAREGKHGAVYEIAGTHANVEMAAHVYALLLATADRLCRENRAVLA